jgi:arylamine N-acetyltransferase
MLSKKDVLSAVVGFSLMALPASALAAGHFDRPVHRTDAWQASAHSSPIVLAQAEWEHHHNHHWNQNDYNWGGHYRYQHPPSYFSGPVPHGYQGAQRRSYLEQRRATAIDMQRQMLARGDRGAADRLGATISQLDQELRR